MTSDFSTWVALFDAWGSVSIEGGICGDSDALIRFRIQGSILDSSEELREVEMLETYPFIPASRKCSLSRTMARVRGYGNNHFAAASCAIEPDIQSLKFSKPG